MTGKSTWSQFTKQQPNTWTDPVTVVYGSYSWLNDAPIHYCLTTLSIKSIWEDIRLMHEIPGVEKWGFEAIFQRVIRGDWVKQIKTGYLSNSERFKFFPPVTIALLPCTSDSILRKYENSDVITFAAHSEGGYVASLPGIEMHFPTADSPGFPHFGAPAMIRWDKGRYAALAIDGQHRISALRAFIPRTSQDSESKDVPATILIFDPKLPFGRDLINVTREIFIDINKNAKAVDSSRLILLDDRNFYNVLTRRLILQAYPDGETPSDLSFQPVEDGAALLVPTGIPQELVDTAAGKEAADITKIKPWQYTSAFILNRTLQYFFFDNRFATFEKILETVDWRTDSEDEVECVVADRREQIQATDPGDEAAEFAEKEDVSFHPSTTEALVDRFMRMYGALVLGVYTGFKPYRDHLEGFAQEAASDLGGDLRSLMLAEGSVPAKKADDLFN